MIIPPDRTPAVKEPPQPAAGNFKGVFRRKKMFENYSNAEFAVLQIVVGFAVFVAVNLIYMYVEGLGGDDEK